MNSWMDWFLLGCTALNDMILSLFCCAVLTPRYKWLYVLLVTFFLPALLFVLDVLGISDITAPHPLRTGISLVFLCTITALCFKDSLAKKLLFLALGLFFPLIATVLLAFPFAFNGFFEITPAYTERNFSFLALQAAICILNMIIAFLVVQWIKKRELVTRSFKLMACFIILQVLLFYTSQIEAFAKGFLNYLGEWLILLMLCTAADAAAFYLIREMDRKIRLEAEAGFYEKQLSMQLDLYRNFSAYTDGLQQVRRRLTRELAQVCTALDRGDYHRVFERSQHLQGDLERLKLSGYCKNSLLNAVLFMKKREMDALGISFAPVVQLEESTFVKRSDLCRIVSNLLDNAVEACAAVPAQGRLIRFTCMPVKHTLLIKTANPFTGNRLPGKTGLPRSTKKETGHGYGLSSVRELISSYEGVLDFHLDEEAGQANVTVTLFEG